MTTDPTLAPAARYALAKLVDHVDNSESWPTNESDPAAIRDFLSGVAGYANSLAGLPIQAELEDRLAAMTAERDAFLDYHVMDWGGSYRFIVRTTQVEGGYSGGEWDTLEQVYAFKKFKAARECARIAALKAAGLDPSSGAATTPAAAGEGEG